MDIDTHTGGKTPHRNKRRDQGDASISQQALKIVSKAPRAKKLGERPGRDAP